MLISDVLRVLLLWMSRLTIRFTCLCQRTSCCTKTTMPTSWWRLPVPKSMTLSRRKLIAFKLHERKRRSILNWRRHLWICYISAMVPLWTYLEGHTLRFWRRLRASYSASGLLTTFFQNAWNDNRSQWNSWTLSSGKSYETHRELYCNESCAEPIVAFRLAVAGFMQSVHSEMHKSNFTKKDAKKTSCIR